MDKANNFGILQWEFGNLAREINFLDLTITIENNRITTKTYQKQLNLYQYISPMSNHPPKMVRGIIFSLMRTYKRQNTKTKDYHDMVIKLFR